MATVKALGSFKYLSSCTVIFLIVRYILSEIGVPGTLIAGAEF